MEKLYTLLTDGNGRYALKFDNDFLYRTDETLDYGRYNRAVDQRKTIELSDPIKIKEFVDKWVEEIR